MTAICTRLTRRTSVGHFAYSGFPDAIRSDLVSASSDVLGSVGPIRETGSWRPTSGDYVAAVFLPGIDDDTQGPGLVRPGRADEQPDPPTVTEQFATSRLRA
jgi:hypothetical protein